MKHKTDLLRGLWVEDKDPQQYGLRSVAFEVGDMLKELPKADLLITKAGALAIGPVPGGVTYSKNPQSGLQLPK